MNTVPRAITIILADDHTLLRGVLARRLSDEAGMEVAASVSNADEAIEAAVRHQPTVTVLDIDMPGTYCFEAARTIQRRCPGTRIIFLSAFYHDRYIEQAIAVHAWGYVVKTEPADVLIAAIRGVAEGKVYYSPEVRSRMVFENGNASVLPARSRSASLTRRELEVLRYVSRGLSEKEMGRLMHVSVHTVHSHTVKLMEKLNIHSRVELATFAIREGIAEA